MHLVSAGMVIRSATGAVLMVHTHNRMGRGLILPGGIVEADESPRHAAEREVTEELGLTLAASRMLAVCHVPPSQHRPARLQFMFAAAAVPDTSAPLRLQPDEIHEAFWLEPDEAVTRHVQGGGIVLAAALEAYDDHSPRYLEADG